MQYQLPYAANLYLEESNQLYVTRVLGLSGYEAGTAWAIKLSAGVDPETVVEVSATTKTGITFTNWAYLGVSLTAVNQTGSTFTGFTKTPSTVDFVTYVHQFKVATLITTGTSAGTGTVTDNVIKLTGTTGKYDIYENMVLAIVRSRAYVQDNVNAAPTTIFDINSLTISSNLTIVGSGDLFGQFTLLAASGATNELYTATLNPNSSSFLPNVVGSDAKDKNTKIWVESVYPDLIGVLDSDGDVYDNYTGCTKYGLTGIASYGYGISNDLITCISKYFTIDYKQQFQTPVTPWVVSQLKGSTIDRLFRFVSISDGNAANQEIKISIANINPITLEFDVVIRDFNDTDANPNVLETFSRCNLIQGTTGFIAQRIGTTDGVYSLLSNYVMVELADNITPDLFPAGFEGYIFNNYAVSATSDPSHILGVAPAIFYKTEYVSGEKVKKVYLGISENAYNGTGINQNFFNFNGYINDTEYLTGFTKTKGFHMDSGATGTSYHEGTTIIGAFEVGVGEFQSVNDVVDPLNPYYDINTRKFTLVPSGGFDGWDVNRGYRSNGDLYHQGGIYDGVTPNGQAMNDFQAWETAINTFSNPEEVTINVFATPGINWSDQTILVQDTIDMIETERTDSLYIIDTPDVDVPIVIGATSKNDVVAAQDIVDMLTDADIDSNYSCTYFPWIQINDAQNNVNIYLPPTGEVAKAMAFTDNTAFPWFAPAGLNRGVTNALKSKYKLSLDARDILYAGRINPMADFADAGTAIFGQKTLQVKDSALNRINVRRLLLQVKVLIANIAIRLVFEQNDQTTIDQFLQKTTPILDTIKRERGLTDFQIKMDSSNNTPETIDRNELYGEIYLKPTRAVEFIGITFTITPTGASFADVGA